MMNKFLTLLIIAGPLLLSSCREVFDEDLEGQYVVVKSPSNKEHVNDDEVLFEWVNLEGANEYLIKIVSPSFNGIKQIVTDTVILANDEEQQSFTYTFSEVGVYEWSIIARNTGSNSETDNNRRILYVDDLGIKDTNTIVSPDETAPAAPILNAVYADSTSALLTWTLDNVNDIESNELDISLDSLFGIGSTNHSLDGNISNYEEIGLISDTTYYWRVLSIDTAGNASEYSKIDIFQTL